MYVCICIYICICSHIYIYVYIYIRGGQFFEDPTDLHSHWLMRPLPPFTHLCVHSLRSVFRVVGSDSRHHLEVLTFPDRNSVPLRCNTRGAHAVLAKPCAVSLSSHGSAIRRQK